MDDVENKDSEVENTPDKTESADEKKQELEEKLEKIFSRIESEYKDSISEPEGDKDENEKKRDEEWEKFFKLLEEDKERLYVISTRGIGDFILAGGLSYAVQERKNKKSTVLVIQKHKMDTGIFFPNISGVLCCSPKAIYALEAYFSRTKKYEGDNYIYANINKKFKKSSSPYDDDSKSKSSKSNSSEAKSDVNSDSDSDVDVETYSEPNWILDWDESLNMLERFKINALKLSPDAPFIYPIIEEISEEEIAALYEKYNIDKERTIILLPHCYTFRKALNKEFWEKMANLLKEKNYIVYTNVTGEEKPIEGTEPFSASFPELYHLTDKVKCFIGINSGIFIFLAMTDAKTFNITPFPQWLWDISMMFPECDNRTFYDTTSYTKNLEKIFGELDVSIKNIKVSQKNIAQENIFYSYDDILEEILREVEKI